MENLDLDNKREKDERIEFRKRMRIRGEEARRIVFKTVSDVMKDSKENAQDEIGEK